MYKILGGDGREYGPIDVETIRQWTAQGRINSQTKVQAVGTADWKPAIDFPELGFGNVHPPSPPLFYTDSGQKPSQALAITSFVFGILSLFCLSIFGAIPAIICGHLAYSRARSAPSKYGGGGFAVAGFVMGYLGCALAVFILPVMLAMLLPALSKAKERAQSINCVNNLKQVGLAYRTWALDHEDQMPFALSTTNGGTYELIAALPDGFDKQAVIHFQVISNELGTPKILVCPADKSKTPAISFQSLSLANISYKIRTDTNAPGDADVLAVCPVHGHILKVDGSVEQVRRHRVR
jgi:hypothetical protein